MSIFIDSDLWCSGANWWNSRKTKWSPVFKMAIGTFRVKLFHITITTFSVTLCLDSVEFKLDCVLGGKNCTLRIRFSFNCTASLQCTFSYRIVMLRAFNLCSNWAVSACQWLSRVFLLIFRCKNEKSFKLCHVLPVRLWFRVITVFQCTASVKT